jgi:hypothetical protein
MSARYCTETGCASSARRGEHDGTARQDDLSRRTVPLSEDVTYLLAGQQAPSGQQSLSGQHFAEATAATLSQQGPPGQQIPSGQQDSVTAVLSQQAPSGQHDPSGQHAAGSGLASLAGTANAPLQATPHKITTAARAAAANSFVAMVRSPERAIVWYVTFTHCQRGGGVASRKSKERSQRALTQPNAAENVQWNGSGMRRVDRPASIDRRENERQREILARYHQCWPGGSVVGLRDGSGVDRTAAAYRQPRRHRDRRPVGRRWRWLFGTATVAGGHRGFRGRLRRGFAENAAPARRQRQGQSAS